MMLLNKSNSIICNLYVVLVWLTARTLPLKFPEILDIFLERHGFEVWVLHYGFH